MRALWGEATVGGLGFGLRDTRGAAACASLRVRRPEKGKLLPYREMNIWGCCAGGEDVGREREWEVSARPGHHDGILTRRGGHDEASRVSGGVER